MENNARDFKGIWIPAQIWNFEGLGIMEKMLWAEIDSFTKNGTCYAGNDYLSKFLGVKERRLQEVLAVLKSKGLIEYASFDGRKRILKSVHPRGAEKCTPATHESAPIYNSLDNKITETHICASPTASAIDQVFEGFWQAYPNKKGKGQAHKAFKSAMARVKDKDGFLEGYKKFLAECQGKDKKYIPHAATWLNGDRWMDEYEEPQVTDFGL